jgi:hypothetical protein
VTSRIRGRHGDYNMLVQLHARSYRCPCCIVATFVTEATHELAINRVMMLHICCL